MSVNISSNKTIARNTFMLYVRMFLIMFISLYTSRVVLSTLGESDFGVYNVVGGMVAMLSFVNSAMSGATQRFFAVGIGEGSGERLVRLFRSSFTIHSIIAVAMVVVAECLGVWYLNNYMVISPERMYAANWVLQFSIVTFGLSIVTVPFNAMVVAHERMKVFAYLSILEVGLKLAVVFLLLHSSFDTLISYSFLLFMVQVFISGFYYFYCRGRLLERGAVCYFYDKGIFGEMLSYSGWSLVGNLAVVAKWQGVNMVLNLFYGTLVNAAWGVALQVNNAVSMMVSNFTMALAPPLTKAYAGGDVERVASLLRMGVRVSYFLTSCVAFPLLLNTEYIMGLWLVDVPDYSVVFVRLLVACSLLESINSPIISTIGATGRIKWNQIIVGGLLLLILPLSYFGLMSFDYVPLVGYVILAIGVVSSLVRIIILHRLTGLSYGIFWGIVPVMLLSFGANYLIGEYLFSWGGSFVSLVLSSCLSVVVSFFIFYYMSIGEGGRSEFRVLLRRIFSRG